MQSIESAISSSQSENTEPAHRLIRKASARERIVATVLFFGLCAALSGCCQPNDPNCRNVSFGPSGAEVAGGAVAVGAVVGTVIAVEVHHAHHTLNGCVSNGPGGMQLHTHGGSKTYTLSGGTTKITPGERVSLHGTRVKPPKHSTADPIFLVERENKDYGPCKWDVLSATRR